MENKMAFSEEQLAILAEARKRTKYFDDLRDQENRAIEGEMYEKFEAMESLLKGSNELTYRGFATGEIEGGNSTGFQPLGPGQFRRLVGHLVKNDLLDGRTSIDLGCGNGGWALMAAAAGIPSYGIDASPYLVEQANKNLEFARKEGIISKDLTCKFAEGNMYPGEHIESYNKFAREFDRGGTLPSGMRTDAYEQLGIDMGDVDLVYAFPWSEGMPFLCGFLEKETNHDTAFVLPHYRGPTGHLGYVLYLEKLYSGSHVFIGKRVGGSK
jgi:SAM-dependent methyltransferase